MSDCVIMRVFVSTFGQDLIAKSSGMSVDFISGSLLRDLKLIYCWSIGRVLAEWLARLTQ